MRLIDADVLMENYGLENATKYGNKDTEQQEHSYSTMMLYEVADMIEDAPTVEAKPVVYGEWIENTAGHYVCLNCRQLAKGDMTGCFKDRKFRQERTDFCPNCGADMRGEKHD